MTAASFPIPLAAPLGEERVHVINSSGKEINSSAEEVTPTECGSAIGPAVNVTNPQAKPGNLCIYVAELENALATNEYIVAPGGSIGAGVAGATMSFAVKENKQSGSGTWAVTAE